MVGAGQDRRFSLQVTDKYIKFIVGIMLHQVAGIAFESHVTAIGADNWPRSAKDITAIPAIRAIAVDASQDRRPSLQVTDKYILGVIGVMFYQVTGHTSENNETSISAELW